MAPAPRITVGTLRATVTASGSTVSHVYDPFGRRIYKSSGLGTTIYLYDGANIVAELDQNAMVAASFAQGAGIDQPLAMLQSGNVSYYHQDGLGSVTSLTGPSGTVSGSNVYDAFGNTSQFGLSNPFRYTGREFDSEDGLYYYRARYYDPQSGRFATEDPIRFLGGDNFYEYAINRPTVYLDPHGFTPETTCSCMSGGGGLEKAKTCCADTAPLSGDESGPNPYRPCETYMKVNAGAMYRWGGNGQWGQLVRSCLLCALKHGAPMHEAHMYCYNRAKDRVGNVAAQIGLLRAVAGAIFSVGLQVTYPNPNDPTMECLKVK